MSNTGLFTLTSAGLKPYTKRVPSKKKGRQTHLEIIYERNETDLCDEDC